MVRVSRRRVARTVVRLLLEQPEHYQRLIKSVAAYLVANHQTNQLDLFVKDVSRELQLHNKSLVAEVISAYPLEETAQAQLKEYLSHMTGAAQVELEEAVDADLLSGMIVRTADQELDITARRQLMRLASLNSGGDV